MQRLAPFLYSRKNNAVFQRTIADSSKLRGYFAKKFAILLLRLRIQKREKFMNIIKKILLVIVLFAISAIAKYVAVLETMANQQAKESVAISDRQYLTNVLREEAVKILPVEQNYTIMTRENINAMLPPGKSIEECEGSCLVETGRNIAADYVCQAQLGSFGGSLTLTVELYETAGNKLLASFNGQGANVNKLLEIIKEQAPAFFLRIRNLTSTSTTQEKENDEDYLKTNEDSEDSGISLDENIAFVNEQDLNQPYATTNDNLDVKETNLVEAGISTNMENNSSSNSVHWVPLNIGVVATVTGVILAVVGNNKAKNAAEKVGKTLEDFDKKTDDAKQGQTIRGIGIGLAITGVVGVGISFAF